MTPPDAHLRWELSDLEPEIVTSRQVLIDVIIGLADHGEALTVIGGHAVMEVTRKIPSLPPPDTTRDADLGVFPQLLSSEPQITARMTELGYEEASAARPGVWFPITQRDKSIHDRDSVDLIAPMSLSKDGLTTTRTIRSARVGDHGKRAVSATEGTELSLVDRFHASLHAFDSDASVDTYIAGPSALLCAKAYKLHDRMNPDELRRNGERLRAKGFADVYRLMQAVTGDTARLVFERGIADSRISDAVTTGRRHLLTLLDSPEYVAEMVADAWGDLTIADPARHLIRRWREQFFG